MTPARLQALHSRAEGHWSGRENAAAAFRRRDFAGSRIRGGKLRQSVTEAVAYNEDKDCLNFLVILIIFTNKSIIYSKNGLYISNDSFLSKY